MGFIAFKTQLQRKLINWITSKNEHMYTYTIPNEAWKKERKMQERRDRENNTVGMQWECNENALRKCNIHLTGVLEK